MIHRLAAALLLVIAALAPARAEGPVVTLHRPATAEIRSFAETFLRSYDSSLSEAQARRIARDTVLYADLGDAGGPERVIVMDGSYWCYTPGCASFFFVKDGSSYRMICRTYLPRPERHAWQVSVLPQTNRGYHWVASGGVTVQFWPAGGDYPRTLCWQGNAVAVPVPFRPVDRPELVRLGVALADASYLNAQQQEALVRHDVVYAEVQLEESGPPAVLMTVNNGGWCGTAGCSSEIYRKVPDGFERICGAHMNPQGGQYPGTLIRAEREAGFHVLDTGVSIIHWHSAVRDQAGDYCEEVEFNPD